MHSQLDGEDWRWTQTIAAGKGERYGAEQREEQREGRSRDRSISVLERWRPSGARSSIALTRSVNCAAAAAAGRHGGGGASAWAWVAQTVLSARGRGRSLTDDVCRHGELGAVRQCAATWTRRRGRTSTMGMIQFPFPTGEAAL